MTRILIIEPHGSGHHATYLRWTVESVLERGWTPIVATVARVLDHPELQFLKTTPAVEVRLMEGIAPEHAAGGKFTILRREWDYWRRFRALARAEQTSAGLAAVVFPYLDYLFLISGLLSVPNAGAPWCGIAMRLWHEDMRSPNPPLSLRWRIARRLLGDDRCCALFCINPSVLTTPAEWFDTRQRTRLRYLPDPADTPPPADRAASRAGMQVVERQVCVLVFGAISERKGILELAAALLGDTRFEDHVLVVAGRMSDGMRAHLDEGPLAELQRQQRLRVLDRTLDAADQAQVFAAADIVWLGYVNHTGTSGVLVQAGLAGLPVIGCDAGEIGWQVKRGDLGEVADVRDPGAVRAALLRLADPRRRAACSDNGRRAFAAHSVANFKRMMSEALAEKVA